MGSIMLSSAMRQEKPEGYGKTSDTNCRRGEYRAVPKGTRAGNNSLEQRLPCWKQRPITQTSVTYPSWQKECKIKRQ
jgi:hypothetical protein